jgi:hypothetical protein
VEAKTLGRPLRDWVVDFWEEIAKYLLGGKSGENNQKLKGEEQWLNDWWCFAAFCCYRPSPPHKETETMEIGGLVVK